MKIGFDAKRAFLNSSGLGNYSRNTLNALMRYFPKNKYILFTPEIDSRLFADYKQFKVVSPRNYIAKKMKSLWRSYFLVPYMKRHEVELFHGLSNELPKGIHKSGIRSVVTIHDLIFMRYPEFYKPIDRKIYFKKVKYACFAADKIIAISRQTKQDIEAFFHVAPGKIELIYQPVSSVFFEKTDVERVQAKYNLPPRFILSVGTLETRKNQLALLRALHSEKIMMPVFFVGKQSSAYSAAIQQFVEDHGMGSRVFFLSNISEEELAALYQSATVSVYISVFEGFGLPVIESMASGCPVITSSTSVLPETAGDAAMLCDPADPQEIAEKLVLLFENENLRAELVRKGRKRAELFHPKNYSQKLVSLYAGLLDTKHG